METFAHIDWKLAIGIAVVATAYWGGLYLLWRKLERLNRSQSQPQYGSQHTEALAKSNGFRHGGWLSD